MPGESERLEMEVRLTEASRGSGVPNFSEMPLEQIIQAARTNPETGNPWATPNPQPRGAGGRFITRETATEQRIQESVQASRDDREINKQLYKDKHRREMDWANSEGPLNYWSGSAEDPFSDGPFGPSIDHSQPDPEAAAAEAAALRDMRERLGPNASRLKLLEQLGLGPHALSAFVSGGVTSLSGSSTLGGLAGTAAGMATAEGGALAGAAGPLAIAAIAAAVVSEFNNKSTEKMRNTAMGFIGGSMGGRGSVNLGGFAHNAAGFLDPTQQAFGLNLSSTDDAIQTFIESIQEATRLLDQMGDGMGQLSGHVASALAQRTVRQLETELFRAERLGPEMADFINARSEVEESLERLKIIALERILPLITKLVEGVLTIIRLIEQGLKTADDTYGAVSDAIRGFKVGVTTFLTSLGFSQPAISGILKGVFELLFPLLEIWLKKERSADPNANSLFQEMMGILDPVTFFNEGPLNAGLNKGQGWPLPPAPRKPRGAGGRP